MEIKEEMKITKRKISELKFAEYNPRKAGEKEIKDLQQSIKKFGFVEPIIVNQAQNRKDIIVGGHFRCRVAKELGIEEIPVVYVNIPDIKKEQELNVRLNKNLGNWDYDLLANFDEDMLKDVGWESDELDQIFKGTEEDEFDAEQEYEKIKDPKVKKGDLYQLGKHRLYCGDATKREDVEKLMGGEKADMVFTDPPYGMFLDTDFTGMVRIGRGKKYDKVIGDNDDFLPDLILKPLEFFKYCKEIFLWGADYYAEILPKKNDGSWIVWDKMQGGEGVNDKYDKMFGSNFELCWSKVKHKRAIARILWKGIFGLDKEPEKKRVHPNQKPIELATWFLKHFSKEENLIVDVYAGSGFTLIACEKTNRICYGMELNEKYCQVILDRWENFTNQKAKKL